MSDLVQFTGKFIMKLDIQEKNSRGIKIFPPILNLKLEQYDNANQLSNTFIIPENVMKRGLDKSYNRLVDNFKKAPHEFDVLYGHLTSKLSDTN